MVPIFKSIPFASFSKFTTDVIVTVGVTIANECTEVPFRIVLHFTLSGELLLQVDGADRWKRCFRKVYSLEKFLELFLPFKLNTKAKNVFRMNLGRQHNFSFPLENRNSLFERRSWYCQQVNPKSFQGRYDSKTSKSNSASADQAFIGCEATSCFKRLQAALYRWKRLWLLASI